MSAREAIMQELRTTAELRERVEQIEKRRSIIARWIANNVADGVTPWPADVTEYRALTAELDELLGLSS